jgi:hypothetical protein
MSDRDTGENSPELQFERIAFLAPKIAGGFFLIIVALYSWNFGGGFGDQATFGAFGDFIGGVLNPFLTFLTVLLLIYSIRFQISELRITRHEMKKNTKEAKETKELQAKNLANEKAMFDKKNKMHEETIKNQNRINAIEQIAIELDTVKADIIQINDFGIIPMTGGSKPIIFNRIVINPNLFLESIPHSHDELSEAKNESHHANLNFAITETRLQISILISILRLIEEEQELVQFITMTKEEAFTLCTMLQTYYNP